MTPRRDDVPLTVWRTAEDVGHLVAIEIGEAKLREGNRIGAGERCPGAAPALRYIPFAIATRGQHIAAFVTVEIAQSDGIEPLGRRFQKDPMHSSGASVPPGLAGREKQIVLAVTWTNASGRSLSRQFTTYYTKNGLYDYYYTLARS